MKKNIQHIFINYLTKTSILSYINFNKDVKRNRSALIYIGMFSCIKIGILTQVSRIGLIQSYQSFLLFHFNFCHKIHTINMARIKYGKQYYIST